MKKNHKNGNIPDMLTTKLANKGLTIFMKYTKNKRSARVSPKKIEIKQGAKGLTAKAGLIPVVKFLHQLNTTGIIKDTVLNVTNFRGNKDNDNVPYLPDLLSVKA